MAALVFRLAIAGPMIDRETVGTLWIYDFYPGLALATGYGLEQEAPTCDPTRGPENVVRELYLLPKPVAGPAYPATMRPPLYAVLTAATMRLTGTTNLRPLIRLQIVLDSLVPLFVFLILLDLGGGQLALGAAVLSVLWLPEAAIASAYYSSALVPFFLALSLWLLLRGIGRSSLSWLAASALATTAIVFLRAEFMFLPVVTAALLLFVPFEGTRLRRICAAILPVAIVATGVCAWSARNYARTGYFSFTNMVGSALWQGMGYGSSLFPEYKEYYDDQRATRILEERGIVLKQSLGNFYDGPRGMEANYLLIRQFAGEVVRPNPFGFLAHVSSKARRNYFNLHNWDDAVQQFVHSRTGLALRVVASCLDLTILLVPFIVVVLLPWGDARQRVMALFLVPLVALHGALALTIDGPLRYTMPLAPCYPILFVIAIRLRMGGRIDWKTKPAVTRIDARSV